MWVYRCMLSGTRSDWTKTKLNVVQTKNRTKRIYCANLDFVCVWVFGAKTNWEPNICIYNMVVYNRRPKSDMIETTVDKNKI